MANLIDLRSINRVYEMGGESLYALNNLTLTIDAGSYVAIMGTSGSGKSTLMNIIGCLDRPTSGTYSLDGVDILSCDDDQLAEVRNAKIGFVFQQFNLLASMTAIDNVMLPMVYAGVPKAERYSRATQVLEQVGLATRLEHRPNQLSGGQQQRVSIARALANRPSILLADEPTGALDSHTAEDTMRLFNDLVLHGITVIVVTHDQDTADHARRIVRMRDGQIVDDSTAKNTNNTTAAG
ncbi:ABC transporter ATP-binding protein [bacterium]|nr:ABC transporter ATP-binding protein [bacterium]MBP9807036.1 ABC transporter ATP-binding protein [bacterium]